MPNKIIQIGEHKIILPPLPPKEDILFINEKEPYWRRQEDLPKIFFDYNKYQTAIDRDNTIYDQDGVLISLSVSDTRLLQRFQTRELKRRTHGVWFKNGDQVIWMPGDYYFNLQWGPMLGLSKKYGDFRWFQNDAMILKWYADNDPNILGIYISKAKKTGITQIMAGAYANEATMTRGKQFGIMSKTFDDDAKATNMALFFHIIESLPDILLPVEKKRNEHEILFGKSRNSKSLKTSANPLDTRVYCSKTKPSGFDGPKMWRVWLDEFPKYWESAKQSPDLVFKKTQETVKLQQQIIGKLYLTSYSPEDNNRGYEESKKIFFDSEIATKDAIMNRTKTGLICHFIGTLESAEGHFLKNGKTNQKTALYFNQAERDLVKNDRLALQAKMRQYPRDKEEAWGVGGVGSIFDVIRLGFQTRDLEDELRTGVRPYLEGRFIWANKSWEHGKRPEGEFCPVFFEALTDDQLAAGESGRLLIYQMPLEKDRCSALIANNRDDYGRLMPLVSSINVGAIDPTDFALKSDITVGSQNASLTMNLYDPILDTRNGKISSNIILSEYLYRPEDPSEFLEDAIKEIIFFDKRVLVEANKKWLVTALKKQGLHNYLLVKRKDGSIAPYRGENYGDDLISSTHSLIDAYVREIKGYLAAPRGGNGIDYLNYIKSLRLLKQLPQFKPENTKIYDITVCFGLNLVALQSFSIFKNTKEEDNDDAGAMQMIFQNLINA